MNSINDAAQKIFNQMKSKDISSQQSKNQSISAPVKLINTNSTSGASA